MEGSGEKVTLKNIISSFKYWPRLLRLLLSIKSTYLIVIIILTLINGVIPTLSVLASQHLINEIQISVNLSFRPVLMAIGLLVVVSVASDIVSTVLSYYQTIYQKIIMYKLNLMIMEKSNSLSLIDFENSEVYDKLSRAKEQVDYRPYQILTFMLTIISTIVTLISSMIVVVAWKPWIMILLIIFPVISSIYTLKVGQMEFIIESKRAGNQRKSWYLSYLLTSDRSFKEVKLYNVGEYILQKFQNINKLFFGQDKYITKKKSKMLFFSDTMEEISSSITLLLVAWSTFLGEILIGNTVGLIGAISLVQNNVKTLIKTFADMYENNLFIEQLFEFLDIHSFNNEEEIKDKVIVGDIKTIEFKNVYFKYPTRDDYTLKNINLKINSRENIALVGKNGCGKTTLIKLLCGLYEVTSGEILINGNSIENVNIFDFRQKIATVFQDFLRYEMPVRENIGLGNLNKINDDEELNSAAKKSGIYEVINTLPNQLDSQLGIWFKNGTQLSGGQWQKVALARAFVRDADLIILDEPSSALDPLAEREMFDNFIDLSNEKIGLFITHRFINARYATRIVVLDDGKIVEEGNHEELMSKNGTYKELYDIQYKLNIEEKV